MTRPSVSGWGRRLLVPSALLLVVALAWGGWSAWSGRHVRTATAYFPSATGIYVGDDVAVLGIKVGRITGITPEPGKVRVTFTYDHVLPADVKAVIEAPSLVPVRRLVLTPAYRSGPRLADRAVIPLSRTAVPVEWDDVKSQLTRLSDALGPNGANRDGSLGRAVSVAADNLRGNGGTIKADITSLSEAMQTLADNRGQVFLTVRNLDVFVQALVGSDDQVAEFNRRLAAVGSMLDAESGDLGHALVNARVAMRDLRAFLVANRRQVGTAVDDLAPALDVLAEHRQSLANILHIGPTAIGNLYGLYDPASGSMAGSFVLENIRAPGPLLCSMIQGLGGTPHECQAALAPLFSMASAVPIPPVGLNPIERNGGANVKPPPQTVSGPAGSRSMSMDRLVVPGGVR